MKKDLITQKLCQLKTAVLVILVSAIPIVSRADGSKNMFPEGGKGYRASLWSTYSCKNTTNPFPTVGVIKVYAKAGEHILMGSSAIGKGDGAIDYIAPDGTKGSFTDKSAGRIENRTQELAGPNFNGSISNGFTPASVTVTAEQEGVWEIYFRSPTYTDTYNADESTSKYSIESWSQNNNDGCVMAFDVSVSNSGNTALIPGRVYTNVLNMNVLQSPNDNKYASSWYSDLYILTDVGYLYKVNTNGQNPHYGTFFSNNKGIQKKGSGVVSPTLFTDPYSLTNTGYQSYQDGEKSYQSNALSSEEATAYIYDPRLQDNRSKVVIAKGDTVWKYEDVTHKIFFCTPALDLPESAKAVYGGQITDTWLKTNTVSSTPTMSNLNLTGCEANTAGVVGPEGMNISFDASVAGGYIIDMQFGDGYTDRHITGTCVKGTNNVKWDGLDGAGKLVTLGNGVKVTISGELTTAEVHFPFTDLENNENGFILQHIDFNGNALSDIIYWDDSNIQTNAEGTDGTSSLEGSASTNGAHRWTKDNSTGDNSMVDTWSYVKGVADKTTIEPTYNYIDLAVTEASANVTSASVGQEITYTLKIANLDQEGVNLNGQKVDTKSDADSAAVGVWVTDGGFVVTEIAVVESDDPDCKVLSQPDGTENALGYISLANGKTATVTVKGYATAELANSNVEAQCFVMRPGDDFETDAKNLDDESMPNDPTKEYAGTTNNNLVTCAPVAIAANGSPVIGDTDNGTLEVAIKADKATDYSENGIMLPIAITDPENDKVTTTLSGDDAANFTVKDGNLYYIGTTPATGDAVTYTIKATATDANGSTTVRNILVTVNLNDGALNNSNLAVVTDTIMYGQPVSEAIKQMTTADTTAAGAVNGEWIVRDSNLQVADQTAVLDAGTYTYECSYYTTDTSDYASGVVSAEVVVRPREVTVTSASAEKVYDGTALSNDELTVSGDGFYGSEGITATNFASIKNAGETDNTFSYSLKEGTNADNYKIDTINGTLKVTAKELTVDGTVVDDKDYDGTTNASVSEMGTLNGVVDGDDVILEKATAVFDSEKVGDEKAAVDYTLAGTDAANYSVKDTVLSANIRAVDANFDWTYDNPVYGDNVGTGEEVFATYKGSALEEGGTYTYFVDGVEVKPTDLVVPGEHAVKVVYTDGNGNSVESLEQKVTFGKAELTPTTDITKTKTYDGTTAATAEVTNVDGKVAEADDVNVVIASSNYDNKNIGEGKTITVNYELTGENADYYTVKENETVTDGVITKADKDAPKVSDGTTTEAGASDGTIAGLTPDMEISTDGGNTWSPADPEAGLPAGEYTVRYPETDTTNASEPVTVKVNDPSDFWNITNPELTYGDATVGGTEKAGVKADPEAELTYAVDGTPATTGDIIPAGKHEITATYTDPVSGTTKDTTFTCTVDKKELTVNGGASEPKVYDGNTDATLAEMGTLTGKIGDDDVTLNEPATVATFDTKNVGTGKDVDVQYALTGDDADNYFVNPVTLTDGVITKADKDAPKVSDGTTTEAGANDGVIAGLTPDMEISTDGGNTWSPADLEAGLPAGEYTVRYPETDTTNASEPVTVKVSDPSDFWNITNPDLTYGDATVGGTEKAGVKSDPEAELTYTVDGTPATTGDIIPAGKHEITATYTDPVSGTTKDTTFTCTVDKKELTVDGGASQPKVYDGNTDATLAQMGTLTGKIGDDDVTLNEPATVATFDTKNVGTGKDVDVVYALTGEDADNYFVNPVTLTDGVITKADKDAPKVSDGTTTEAGASDGTIAGLTPDMEISTDGGNTWSPADPETGLPAGEYTVRYPETDTTNASEPVTVKVSDPSDFWNITNPDLTYGDATVGGTEKAGVKADPEAELTYAVDGTPANTGDIIPAGKHEITATYTDPVTGTTKDTTFTCTVDKKELTVDGGASEPKVYDGNTDATLAEMGTLTGKIGDDDVTLNEPATVATFDTKNVGTGKDVDVVYALTGEDADNYFVNPVTLTDGVITKADKDAPKVSDGTTTEAGANDGVIAGLTPDMEISTDGGNTWSPADPEAGLPAGEYTVRYPETDTTNASEPVTVKVADPSDFWNITNPELTYGDATVGGTEKAGVKADPEAELTYAVDGTPATTGDIIPAGKHEITATYTDPVTGTTKDTTFTCTIDKKELTVDGGASQPKVYDGNTDATLAQMGTLTGKIGDDDVTLNEPATVATFDTKNVGTGKDVDVVYALTGEDADNYFVNPVTLTDGVINKADKDAPKVSDGTTTEAGASDGTIAGLTPDMEISTDGGNTWSPADPEAGLPAGEYTVRYPETDTTNASEPVTVKVNDPSDFWNITNPELTYGDATVGGTEKAGVKADPEAELTYAVDGTPANTGDIIPAGKHEITATYTDPVTGTTKDTTFTCTVDKKELTVDGGASEPKVYDGNTDATLAQMGTLNGKIGDDDVTLNEPATVATFDTKNVGTGKDVDVQYALTGEDADNYFVNPVTLTDGVITKADKDAPKVSDGTTTEAGANDGVIAGLTPDMEISTDGGNTWSPADPAAGLPAGEYTVRYPETDTTNASEPVTVKVNDPSDFWNITNPELTYGDATVGGTEKAGVKADPEAELTYAVDGTPANTGDIIPAGKHEITATYTDPVTGTTKDTTFTCTVDKKELTVDGGASEPKVYDGNTDATLAQMGTLTGKIGDDDVTLNEPATVATFDTKNVGTGKDVDVVYALTGDDADNYFVNPVTLTDGVITKADKDAPKVSDGTTTEAGANDGVIAGLTQDMEISTDGGNTWSPADPEAGLPAGEYTVRYPETDSTNASEPVTVKVNDPSDFWNITNPELTYGDATVGGTEKAGVKADPEAELTYTVDGTPATTGDIIPAGKHEITATYTDPVTGTTKDTTFTCTVDKKELTVDGGAPEPKVYDGNTDATLAQMGTLNGKIGDDDVTLNEPATVATFDTKNVGTGKNVDVQYALTGEDADNYFVNPVTLTDGVITKADKDAPKVSDGTTTEAGANDGVIAGLTPDMEISTDGGNTWSPADPAAGLPAGEYTVRYPETDTTNASEPVTVKVADPSDFWNITNPELTYGDATVGGTEKAGVKADPEAELTYAVDGTPANTGDVIPAGKHEITATYTDPVTGTTKDTTFTCTVDKKELTVDGGASQPKVYDGNTDATLAEMGTLTGKIGDDDVTLNEPATVATFDTKNVGTGKDVDVQYALTGEDADNYFVNPVTLTDGVITKADKDAPKVSDGTTTEAGANDGVIAGLTPDMEISTDGGNTWSPADPAAGLPAGEYTVRYPETDTTNASEPVTVKVSDPSDFWNITNPELTYGDATVGGTEKAGVKSDPEAELTYAVDGTPATTGDIIPAGKHEITATYTDPVTGTTKDTTFTCTVDKKELTVDGGASEPKVYDGNTDATLAEMGTLTGKIGDDDVTLNEPATVATFDTKNVGTGKDVDVVYALTGDDADNYFVNPVTLTDGVITKADKDAPKVSDGTTTEVGASDGTIAGLTPDMEISTDGGNTWSPADPAAGLPAGEYTVRYPETDTTNASEPVTVKVADPSDFWNITNPELTYGDATVGGTEKAGVKADPEAELTYAVDGTPATTGDIIPAGKHEITATYTDPVTGTTKDTTFTCTVDKKELTVDGGASEPKVYDGNTDATLAEMGTLTGKIGDDDVTLNEPATVATFDTKNVGTGKDVDVQYALTGDDADNYFVNPVTLTDGVITKADKEAPKVSDGTTTEAGASDGTIAGLTPDMEISTDGGNTWSPADPAAGLPAGEYSVRYPETDTTNASEPVTVKVNDPSKGDKAAPEVEDGLTSAEGASDGEIAGLTPDMEISTDGGNTWTPADPEAGLPAGEYEVRYAETDSTEPSEPVIVHIYDGVINMVDDSKFVVDVDGYCPETDGVVLFKVIAGNPNQFRAVVVNNDNTKLEDLEFSDIDENGQFKVYIPLVDAGTYNVKVQFRNANGSVSPVYNFAVNVNLSEKYVYDIWEDVVSIVNKNTPDLDSKDFEKRFTEFQWYKDDKKIEGATKAYYNEKGGLNGVYYAEVLTVDNRRLRTCTREWHYTYGLSLTVYPNPVVTTTTVELSSDNGEEHQLVVTDMNGVVVKTATFFGKKTHVDFTYNVAGWYVINVDNAEVKVIKE